MYRHVDSINVVVITPDSKFYGYVSRKLIADDETHTKVGKINGILYINSFRYC
jgi:hypothetical protein